MQKIIKSARTLDYERDTYLYRLGEQLKSCYCVAEGSVQVKLRSVAGQEFTLTELTPGSWFGEAALTGEPIKMFEAMAHRGTRLVELPANVLIESANQFPQLYRNLFKEQVAMTSNLSELLSGTVFHGLEARVAGRLVWLQKHYGRNLGDELLIDKKFTQQDIADLALGSRQRVNKIINNFVSAGILRMEQRRILIRDLKRLREISRRAKSPVEEI